MTRIIPIMPVFVLVNLVPAAIWATDQLRKLAEKEFGLNTKKYRAVNLVIKTFDTIFIIGMIVQCLSYTTTGWPCPVWTIIAQCILIMALELKTILDAVKECRNYITTDSTDITSAVISVIVPLFLSAYLACFIVTAFGDWNFYI